MSSIQVNQVYFLVPNFDVAKTVFENAIGLELFIDQDNALAFYLNNIATLWCHTLENAIDLDNHCHHLSLYADNKKIDSIYSKVKNLNIYKKNKELVIYKETKWDEGNIQKHLIIKFPQSISMVSITNK